MQRKFGWNGPRPYKAEQRYSLTSPTTLDHVDRMSLFRPIRDQGQEGDCTGFGTTGAVETATKCPTLSAQFVYFNARVAEATQDSDSGASVGDAVESVMTYGAAAESVYPTVVGSYAMRPTLDAYADAMERKGIILQPQRVRGLAGMKHALANGYPVVFGFSVPAYYESLGADGYLPVPDMTYSNWLGGHCQFFDGFDDRDARPFIWAPGSWGPDFACNGWVKFDQAWISDSRGLVDEMYAIVPG